MMKDRNPEISLMPEFDSEEEVFAGHPEFTHTLFHEGN